MHIFLKSSSRDHIWEKRTLHFYWYFFSCSWYASFNFYGLIKIWIFINTLFLRRNIKSVYLDSSRIDSLFSFISYFLFIFYFLIFYLFSDFLVNFLFSIYFLIFYLFSYFLFIFLFYSRCWDRRYSTVWVWWRGRIYIVSDIHWVYSV